MLLCMPFFHEVIHLSKDEAIVGTFRSHAIVAILSIAPFACILIILCLFVFPLLSLGIKGVAFFFLLAILDILFIITLLSQWIGTLLIVTNRRIIKINRRSMISKFVHEYQLETITEISYDCKGIIRTVFTLGDINVTALYTGARYTVITYVQKPQRVLDVISHAIAKRLKANDRVRNIDDLHSVRLVGDEHDISRAP